MKIIYLSSYLPRQCGIASFTDWLMSAVKKENPVIQQSVIAINETDCQQRKYPKIVIQQFNQADEDAFKTIAAFINNSGADLFCLQHEFGLYGRNYGKLIVELLKRVKIPTITFLHTIPVLPRAKRRLSYLKLIKKMSRYSAAMVTTSLQGKRALRHNNIPANKIFMLPHGALTMPFKNKQKLNPRKIRLFTYGLIAKSKGLHFAVSAMETIVVRYPQAKYIIAGAPHPINAKNRERDYYESLRQQVIDKHLEKNVKFFQHYLTEKQIISSLLKTDIALLPYLSKAQISSGIIANAMAAGTCVVSTPFTYAQDMIGRDGQRGYYIKFADAESISQVVIKLIRKPTNILRVSKAAHQFGCQFTWKQTAKKFIAIMKSVKRG